MAEGNGSSNGFSIIAERTVPDVYADSAQFEVTLYSFSLEFGKTQRPPSGVASVPHIPRVRVHMSPQHAKVMALMMLKNIRAYEAQVAQIVLPPTLLKDLGLEDEDGK